MSQTILIEPRENRRKLYGLNLQTYAGTDIIERTSSQDTIELIKILPTVNLIICPALANEIFVAAEISKFLKGHKIDIPMIVLGQDDNLDESIIQLDINITWEALVKHAAKRLGITEEILQQRVRPNYIAIAFNYFHDLEKTPCDVFIRIKAPGGEYRFVKRFHAQDPMGVDEVNRYVEQGVKNFYIPKDYQQYFVTYVTNSLVSKLNGELSLEERLQANSNAMELVKEHLKTYGVSPEINDLVDTAINSMIKAVLDAPKMADLLQMLFSSQISYGYQKAHLSCAFGNFIIAKQKWYDIKYLRTFACLCFFADITLKTPKLMAINSSRELAKANLAKADLEIVTKHAQDAAHIADELEGLEEGIGELIRQQHGALDGIGFPDQPSEQAHALSKIYIVVDAFVKVLLDSNRPNNKRDILMILFVQFKNESYQKIIKFLEQKIE